MKLRGDGSLTNAITQESSTDNTAGMPWDPMRLEPRRKLRSFWDSLPSSSSSTIIDHHKFMITMITIDSCDDS